MVDLKMRTDRKGLFITFEGIDGCGKSTQARLLARELRRQGHAVVLTREPGGTALGRRLRPLLLHPDSQIGPVAEVFLYLADRAQHVQDVIAPALAEGKIVISERFADSTLAYQGAGRGLPQARLEALNRLATEGLKPDLTILLDISPKQAKERKSNGPRADRLERLESAFHARLARQYRKLAAENPKRIRLIKASGSVQEVHRKVMEAVCSAQTPGTGMARPATRAATAARHRRA